MKKGDVIIIPTDTVYGLAAALYDEEALQKIYEIKGREQSKQIPILCASVEQLNNVCKLSDDSKKLMKNFWPGALTIVLETTKDHEQKTGESTIAARMPNHQFLLSYIKKNGLLRATSLNKSGEPPLSNFAQIMNTFAHLVDAIYQQEETIMSNVSSTVVDLTKTELIVLRQGDITHNDLLHVIKT